MNKNLLTLQTFGKNILSFTTIFVLGFSVGAFSITNYQDRGLDNYIVGQTIESEIVKIDTCFSPRGNCADLICKNIDSAKEEILVQAYSFTSKKIAESLLRAKKRGVVVRVMTDRSAAKLKNSTNGDDLSEFSEEGQKLISMSTVPILNLMIIDSINNSMTAKQFSEVIAIDIALRYSEEIIDTVRNRVLELEQVQFDKSSFESFKEQLNVITGKLRAEKILAAGKLQGLSGLTRYVNSESDRMYHGLADN